jgi:hypothetical protein
MLNLSLEAEESLGPDPASYTALKDCFDRAPPTLVVSAERHIFVAREFD